MKHWHPLKTFLVKKILLDERKDPKTYYLHNFGEFGHQTITETILYLASKKYINLAGIKIHTDFFRNILSPKKGFFFDDKGSPISIGTDLEKIKEYYYIGLGEELFKKYEATCCSSGNIAEPERELTINEDELWLILSSLGFFVSDYVSLFFKNLFFYICLDAKQRNNLNRYLDDYLKKFSSDDLEIESATDFYHYAKQREMLVNTIEHFRKDHKIKNLWIKEEDVNFFGGEFDILRPIDSKHELLETALCLEREGTRIKIEGVDVKKGIKITDSGIGFFTDIKSSESVRSDCSITIDFQRGIWLTSDQSKRYEISGKRKDLLKYISGKQVSGMKDLIASSGWNDQAVVRAINKINGIFRKKVCSDFDLIRHNSTAGGYYLNKDELKIDLESSQSSA